MRQMLEEMGRIMAKLKHKITAVLLLIVIFSMAFLYVFYDRVSFKEAIVESELGSKYDSLSGVYESELPLLSGFVNIWGGLQSLMNVKLFDDAEYGYIALDNNGMLHFPVGRSNVDDELAATVALRDRLTDIGVGFAYIQFPSKNIRGYTVLPNGAVVMSNENADELLGGLKNAEVNTFDVRERISKWELDLSEIFYKSDHHWTTRAAFEAFRDSLSYINDTFDLALDSEYYGDISNYNVTLMPKSFLGSQGRRVGVFVTGLDDYTFISPKFDTSFTVTDLLGGYVLEGDFDHSIVREHILTDSDNTTNRHGAYFEWDYGNLRIENHNAENDVKILLIKDSFSLPYAAFLSNCVSELHMIDMREGGAINIAEYCEMWNIDVVLVAYNTGVFDGVMFNFN